MLEGIKEHLDVLHIVLITGFCSFISSTATLVVTKYRLSEKFLSAKEFNTALESLRQGQEDLIRRMFDHCEIMRSKCPFGNLVNDVKDIRNELIEIREVQRRRTDQLSQLRYKDNEIWRIIMSRLDVPVEEQNKLLSGGN